MVYMRMWYFEQLFDQSIILHGIVKGHPYLYDGNQIHTSRINYISELDDRIIVQTQNTEYHLMYESCDKKNFYKFRKTITDAMVTSTINRILTKIDDAILKRKYTIDFLKKNMENNTILFYIDERDTNIFFKHPGKSIKGLELINTNYMHSYRRIDPLTGEKMKIEQIPKRFSALTEDYSSVILQYDILRDKITFRTSMNELFYDKMIPEGALLGYIKNNTIDPLEITFSWGDKIILECQEAVKVYYKRKSEVFC